MFECACEKRIKVVKRKNFFYEFLIFTVNRKERKSSDETDILALNYTGIYTNRINN